jgi:hypothetical protein
VEDKLHENEDKAYSWPTELIGWAILIFCLHNIENIVNGIANEWEGQEQDGELIVLRLAGYTMEEITSPHLGNHSEQKTRLGLK